MMQGYLRVWKELDLNDIEKYLLVIGELSSECYSCHKVGLEVGINICPNCNTAFKYMGFRRNVDMNYLRKLREQFPYIVFIDFDDFKKMINKRDARNLFNI